MHFHATLPQMIWWDLWKLVVLMNLRWNLFQIIYIPHAEKYGGCWASYRFMYTLPVGKSADNILIALANLLFSIIIFPNTYTSICVTYKANTTIACTNTYWIKSAYYATMSIGNNYNLNAMNSWLAVWKLVMKSPTNQSDDFKMKYLAWWHAHTVSLK